MQIYVFLLKNNNFIKKFDKILFLLLFCAPLVSVPSTKNRFLSCVICKALKHS